MNLVIRWLAISCLVVFVVAVLDRCSDAQTRPDTGELRPLVLQLTADAPEIRDPSEGKLSRVAPYEVDQLEALLKDQAIPQACRDRLETLMKFIRARRQHAIAAYERESPQFDWLCQQATACYDRDSHHQAKWDQQAHLFFREAWVTANPRQPPSATPSQAQALSLIQPVVSDNCDNPAVLLTTFMRLCDSGVAVQESISLLRAAAKRKSDPCVNAQIAALIDGRLIRSEAQLTKSEDKLTDEQMRQALDDMIQQTFHIFSMPGATGHVAYQAIDNLLNSCSSKGVPIKDTFDKAEAAAEAQFPNDHDLLSQKGYEYIQFAWAARGSGFANTVTPDGWATFFNDLTVAKIALERAYDLDPTDEIPATNMITVCMGAQLDRATMEKWYQRAMQANPDSWDACFAKEFYLQPRWYGTPDQAIAFGKELVAQGNWSARLPLCLFFIHKQIGETAGIQDYWHNPTVWADLNPVFTEYLLRYPDDQLWRARYALTACSCDQWKVAQEQFALLGDYYDPEIGAPRAMWDKCRDHARELAEQEK